MSAPVQQALDLLRIGVGTGRRVLVDLFARARNNDNPTSDSFDEDAIQSLDPLISDSNWDNFLETIGISGLKYFLKAGENHEIYLDDCYPIWLEIKTDTKPKATITVATSSWDLDIIIKQQPDFGNYILDEAYITRKPLNPRAPCAPLPVAHFVSVENDSEGNNFLPRFLEIFSETANTIVHRCEQMEHDEMLTLENELDAKLRPMVRELIRIENQVRQDLGEFNSVTP